MTRKHGLYPITILGVLGCLIYFATFGKRTTSIESIQQLVQKNVRTGESPEELIHFLRDQNLDPSDLIESDRSKLGGRDYAGQKVVVAVKRYSARALLWKERIYAVFVFDGDRRLVRYDIWPRYESF